MPCDCRMSLVVSLRVPDGIVVAVDSLSLSQNIYELAVEGGIECPNCQKKITEGFKLPGIPIPFSASSYTQKLFSLFDDYSISTFGQGVINGRSIYYHINNFERSHKNKKPSDLEELREALIHYFDEEIQSQYPNHKEKAPENWHPLGFHLNGYEHQGTKQLGVTYEVFIGRENIVWRRDQIGCTVGGDSVVVKKLWQIGKEDPKHGFKYGLFSMQDAIDLSEYFIHTTSMFQRFANDVSTVGGEIDIALVTPFHGFQWIKRKELMKTLEVSKKDNPGRIKND